ncbi:MAG: chemotaxis protein CheX [Pirellulaceae bacterium]|nr:chemotaxis protein CheX [Pirellulaceae bacterium]
MLKSPTRTAMSSEYMPHFVEGTKAIFHTILGWDIKMSSREHGKEFRSGHDVSGIISFSGEVQGMIVLSIDKQVGFEATKAFTGEWPATINNDVRDMVAELANMIAGRAKELINIEEIALGLPTSVSGTDHVVSFNPVAEVESVRFRSPGGNISIQIAMQR